MNIRPVGLAIDDRRKSWVSQTRSGIVPARGSLAIQRYVIAGLVAAYMISIYEFKTWYFVAGAALASTALLILLGQLRYRGVAAAVGPVCVYFFWLLSTALWANEPSATVWFATADSIAIAVAALFYLLALNQPGRVGDVFLAFVWLAVPISAYIFWRDPEASRSGGYAIAVLPFVPAFCWAEIARGRRPVRAALCLSMVFALLIFARSRTPILVAVFTTGLAVFAFSRGIFALLRRTLIAVGVLVLAFGALVYFRPTRALALTTFSRFTHVDVDFGGVYVKSEILSDPLRAELHKAAIHYGREYFFFGLGYHNFPPYFARYWSPIGREYTLHSMYETWWVEGGLVCLLIMTWIFCRSLRSLARAMRRSVDPEVRILARVVIIGILGAFVFGLFHQTQQNPMMYALIGIAAALPRAASMKSPGTEGKAAGEPPFHSKRVRRPTGRRWSS